MLERPLTALRMNVREQLRRPLVNLLLVAVPALFITWNLALAKPVPQILTLPGGDRVAVTAIDTTAVQGIAMTVGLLAGLCGLFTMQSALEADRRLVIAGFRPAEVIVPRLAVLAAATALVLAVALAVTAFEFVPDSWLRFAGGALLAGLIYALIGALAAPLLGRLGAVYFMFFLPLLDLGVVQNPEFWQREPDSWTRLLPAHGPVRLMVDGAFSPSFDATGDLILGLAWLLALAVVAILLLRRSFSHATA